MRWVCSKMKIVQMGKVNNSFVPKTRRKKERQITRWWDDVEKIAGVTWKKQNWKQ